MWRGGGGGESNVYTFSTQVLGFLPLPAALGHRGEYSQRPVQICSRDVRP